MSVPHNAQESLSSERTPTLSYSLPFYHSIVEDWEHLKQVHPLLSPFVEIGIRKVEEYVNKSKLSRTYLLAVCKPPLPFNITHVLTERVLVLNPCLKMKWIEKNCSTEDVHVGLNEVSGRLFPQRWKKRLYYLPERSVRTTVLVQYEYWYKQERKRKADLLLSNERKGWGASLQ